MQDIANYLLALYDSVDAIRADLDVGRLKLGECGCPANNHASGSAVHHAVWHAARAACIKHHTVTVTTLALAYRSPARHNFLLLRLHSVDKTPLLPLPLLLLLSAVLNPNFEIITRLMFQTNYSTLHYNIHDNSGKSMVIEYSGPNNLQVRARWAGRQCAGLGSC